MLQHLLLYLMSVHIPSIYATCHVTRIIMRVPRETDIGLIFDLTVTNRKKDKSEVLALSVSGNGDCTLNMTNGEQFQAGTIFGGEFGSIEPGDIMTVSLVWPTVSLYNRVGSCPVVISTVNHRQNIVKTNQILYFDTRFETLDPSNHSLRRHSNYINCKNWDLNYLRNCTPLNCEERYFGKRSFYNRTAQRCEPVPPCFGGGIIYDFYANECMDMNNFITDEEIQQIKQGKFDHNQLELQPNVRRGSQHTNENCIPKRELHYNEKRPAQASNLCNFAKNLSLVEFSNCFQHLQDVNIETANEIKSQAAAAKDIRKKSTATSILENFYYDWYMPLKRRRDLNKKNDKGSIDEHSGVSATESHYNYSDEMVHDKSGTKVQITSGTSTFWDKLAVYSSIEWIVMGLEVLLIISMVIIFQIVVTLFTYVVVCSTLYVILEIVAELRPYQTTGSHLGKKLTPRHTNIEQDVMTSASLMSFLK